MAKKQFNGSNVTTKDFLRDAFNNDVELFCNYHLDTLVEYFNAYLDALNTDKNFNQDILCEKTEDVLPMDRAFIIVDND